MLTINNPVKGDELHKWLGDKAKYFVYQLEMGENKTKHIQGYVIFKGNQRLAGLKKLHPRAHWEVRRGTHEQALEYCTKDDTRIKEPVIWGEPPAQGKRSDLLAMKETIDANPAIKMEEVFDKHFSTALRYSAHIKEYIALKAPKRTWKTEVTVCWGPPGTGKTRMCHAVSPNAYIKDATCKWWDNYDGVADVIIDDFYGGIQHTTMLALLDRYPCQVECKGGVINFAPRRLFITSNKKYTEWYGRPEGTDEEAWITKINAIERRIDNLLTFPELGTINIVKGAIPLPVVNAVVEDTATPVIPVPDDAIEVSKPKVLKRATRVILPSQPKKNNTNYIDDDDASIDMYSYISDEDEDDEELDSEPKMSAVMKLHNAFKVPRKLKDVASKLKKRKYRSSSSSDSSDEY